MKLVYVGGHCTIILQVIKLILQRVRHLSNLVILRSPMVGYNGYLALLTSIEIDWS